MCGSPRPCISPQTGHAPSFGAGMDKRPSRSSYMDQPPLSGEFRASESQSDALCFMLNSDFPVLLPGCQNSALAGWRAWPELNRPAASSTSSRSGQRERFPPFKPRPARRETHPHMVAPVFPGCQQNLFDGLLSHSVDRNYNVPLEGLRSGLPKTHPAVLRFLSRVSTENWSGRAELNRPGAV